MLRRLFAGGGIIDPLLGSLADNGGPTLTHALLAGSPAINAGDPAATRSQVAALVPKRRVQTSSRRILSPIVAMWPNPRASSRIKV